MRKHGSTLAQAPSACLIQYGNIEIPESKDAKEGTDNLNYLHPLVLQQDQYQVEHANQDITFDLLLQPNYYKNDVSQQEMEGYRPA